MTFSEENYLKTIYHLGGHDQGVSTNAIADRMQTKASSVTDMLKKLAVKELIDYRKYQGVILTEKGRVSATMIIRKHRLWEVFLVDKLGFAWDEVHEIAEQLEHIKSEQLVNRLDDFLDNPKVDPHGDAIPDANGVIERTEKVLLSELPIQKKAVCIGVRDSSDVFLKYLDKHGIALGTQIEIIEKEHFDSSLQVMIDSAKINISNKIAGNLFVKIL